MREGPLADLFRSTADDAPVDPPELGARRPAGPVTGEDTSSSQAAGEEPTAAPPAGGASETDADQVEASPVEREGAALEEEPRTYAETSTETPPERLKRVFEEPAVRDERVLDTPRYGREEPEYEPLGSGQPHHPVIRVVGVGGAGVNAVNRMVEARVPGVEFMAVNTDLQSLQLCVADVTVHIGEAQTRGLGAGADPELGHRSAFDEQDRLKRLLKGSDMVFVAAGAGGGTGTGAAPVIARLAREVGALTVGIVTKPFSFEGSRRGNQAGKGIEALAAEVDTLIVVPNDRLLEVLDQQTSMVEAFQVADDVLRQGVQGISDLVTLPALINLDFADVRTIMSDAGRALLGIGMGTGEGRAMLAAEKAISSPLLETSMEGARSILLSITGGDDLSLVEVSEAAKLVGDAAHPDANIIFGANVDDALTDQVWVTVVATRFDGRSTPPRRGGEPTIRRTKGEGRGRGRASSRDELGSLDVPEFLPG
ncbi:MAG TPA: cell division protein FtsZ [Solirubrobacterales bacterium]|jgi:cell division protein FtsZ